MRKISIISSMGIGDIITSGPLVKKLKKVYPESKITIYSIKGGYLEKSKIFYVDKIARLNSIEKFFKFFQEKADILISVGYYSKGFNLLKIIPFYLTILLSKANKKIFYGNLNSPKFHNKNIVQIKLDILKKLDLKINKRDYNLFIPFSFKKGKKKIAKNNPLILFHIGVKKGYFTRFWPPERWAKVINCLIKKYQAKIGFIGGKEDSKKTDEIIKMLKLPVLNLTGKLSLQETTDFINECELFISTNSGPMWLAAALRKPQIALCGAQAFFWDPFNSHAIITRKIIPRKYCNPPCNTTTCKYQDNLCMMEIKVKNVIKSIEQQIQRQ